MRNRDYCTVSDLPYGRLDLHIRFMINRGSGFVKN